LENLPPNDDRYEAASKPASSFRPPPQVCEDKKGEETRILELDPIDSGLSDFFLVTSATNDRQAIAIADEIEHKLKKEFGVFPNSVEGRRKGDWILLDYVDFVVHVFLAERRAFYDIERLRKSARPADPGRVRRRVEGRAGRQDPRKRLKNCAPTLSFAVFQPGTIKPLLMLKSVSV
jgi:ribosome silencing factor RsfS/YbeB/iojap